MKNIYLTFLFLAMATFSFGQFNATYSATNINGPFENGEEVHVDWDFSNFTNHFVTANASFQFVQGATVISTEALGSTLVGSGATKSGTFTFTFGSGCDIPAGNYTVNLVVSYDHAVSSNTPVNINYNGASYCAPYVIPGSLWSGPNCTIPVFSNQNFIGGCCEDITLDIVTSKASKSKPCGVQIGFTVSGIPGGSGYTHEWGNGSNLPFQYIYCGEQSYTVTVFWTSADGTSCSETITELVRSPCYCTQEPPRKRQAAEGEEQAEVEVSQEVEVYPNPSNGRMYLKIAEGQHVHQIQVFNTLGQLEQDIRGTFVETQELTLDNTTTGLRYLKVFFHDGQSKTVQVLVQ